MKCLPKCRSRMVFAIAGSLLSIVMTVSSAYANNTYATNLVNLFRDSGIKVGGWINAGALNN